MPCFTIETAVGGCEGRRCEMAGAAMLAYGRLCSPMVADGRIGAPLGSEIAGGYTGGKVTRKYKKVMKR